MMNFQYIEDLDVGYLNVSLYLKERVFSMNENSAKKSSSNVEKAQEVEKSFEVIQKELPKHLKYAFLGAERSKLVNIAVDLTKDKKQKLIKILMKYKEAIAWLVEDLKGISPSIYMHKILLEEHIKTSIKHKRRLNPIMIEFFMKEVLKWLNARFIYAISNNPWVGPVHVVPKKGGFTVIRNKKN